MAKICETIDFQGDIIFDKTKPDGTPRKLLDCAKINSMGWQPKITLETGLAEVYQNLVSDKLLDK